RRDAERMRQILLAQRRLAPARRRRGRPMALVRRDYFDEALLTYELTAHAVGRDASDVDEWLQLRRNGDDDDGGPDGGRRRRRRRRGGRRRRPSLHGEGGGDVNAED
ncbi:MAG: poly(A) polymerase, partial [Myxococcota bacterium]